MRGENRSIRNPRDLTKEEVDTIYWEYPDSKIDQARFLKKYVREELGATWDVKNERDFLSSLWHLFKKSRQLRVAFGNILPITVHRFISQYRLCESAYFS